MVCSCNHKRHVKFDEVCTSYVPFSRNLSSHMLLMWMYVWPEGGSVDLFLENKHLMFVYINTIRYSFVFVFALVWSLLFKLTLNSERHSCPCLLRAKIKGVYHHIWLDVRFKNYSYCGKMHTHHLSVISGLIELSIFMLYHHPSACPWVIVPLFILTPASWNHILLIVSLILTSLGQVFIF